MRNKHLIAFLFFLLCCPAYSHAQAWSGILKPTYGTGACNPVNMSAPGQCAIDWSTAGVPGGIPSGSWTQSGSTITSTGSDQTSAIQTALNACGTNHFVLLAAGTFTIAGSLSIPSNCALRGAGANQTILHSTGTNNPPVTMGSGGPNCGTYSNGACSFPSTVSITSGGTAGSQNIVVSSSSGLSTGMYFWIDQLNDGTFVTNYGGQGTCSYCDAGITSTGTRVQGQMVEITSISGTTIGISPPLYVSYTNTPQAISFSAHKYSGLENLQIYANNTHSSGANDASNITMNGCAYCWISGVEGNYTDGDHARMYGAFHSEIVNSYFSNSYSHGPGVYDSDVVLAERSTLCLVQNNIFERLHASLMLEWGAAGNVIAYNYMFGIFDNSAPNVLMIDFSTHGGHPQFNLFEGNVTATIDPDNIWGSSANSTTFRNWSKGTTKICNPMSGRSAVSCAGANGWWANQAAWAMGINYLDNDWNLIGDVVGSADQSNTGLSFVNMVVGVCGPSPCGTNSRPYSSHMYDYSFGYTTAGDTGGGSDTLTPYTTALLHGEYSNITSTITWASGITHTLPASFYLSSQPSWWTGGMAYPAIGPDVTGGTGPGGHVYSTTAANPAQNCYFNVMGGTDGTGSPLTFNADACYPLPPTNVGATAH